MNNLILLGYRASGKTTLGKMLADELWKTFVDLDDVTRGRFDGASIAEIWAEHGEDAFRAAEVEATKEICAKDDQVIALGGGTVMQPAAREAVAGARDSLRIYLYCEAQVLFNRIHGDVKSEAERPSLTEKGGTLEEIEQVLAERDAVYRAVADKVFDVTHMRPDNGLKHLIQHCL